MEAILSFDEVAQKYSKANKDATAMAKTKIKKRAELEAKLGEYNYKIIDEKEVLEQAMITPGKDVVEAYEQVSITEAKRDLVKNCLSSLYPENAEEK